jgi:Flp pilus assembly protein TadG
MKLQTPNPVILAKKVKGAAMIEFAIILPLLLIVIVGVLELGLILIQDNSLNKATREASRYLATNWNVRGCYTNIAEDVVKANMTNMFSSAYSDWNNGTDSVTSEEVCINETTGAVGATNAASAICKATANLCAGGGHLHIRTRVTYKHKLLMNGLFGLNFTPTLSATSIMRVQK